LRGSDSCKLLIYIYLSPPHRENDINLCFLLYGKTILYVRWDRWKPFLCFDNTITTNQFHTSIYRKPLSKDRIRLHKEIMKLHDKGWGYTKIHRYLVKNGFEIGKSRTTVDSIIKKIKKREKFLSQPIIDGIGNFRVEMMEIK
jgi:hypothetical protein